MNIYLLIAFSFIFSTSVFAQDYETLFVEENPTVQVIKGPFYSTPPAIISKNNNQEINYISDNISCINVVKHEQNVYLSWNVCDDTTLSEFFIVKTQEGVHTEVARILNRPCNAGVPILYSATDSYNTNKTSFYKFFKITSDGVIKHIVTVLLPVPEPVMAKSKKKKLFGIAFSSLSN